MPTEGQCYKSEFKVSGGQGHGSCTNFVAWKYPGARRFSNYARGVVVALGLSVAFYLWMGGV